MNPYQQYLPGPGSGAPAAASHHQHPQQQQQQQHSPFSSFRGGGRGNGGHFPARGRGFHGGGPPRGRGGFYQNNNYPQQSHQYPPRHPHGHAGYPASPRSAAAQPLQPNGSVSGSDQHAPAAAAAPVPEVSAGASSAFAGLFSRPDVRAVAANQNRGAHTFNNAGGASSMSSGRGSSTGPHHSVFARGGAMAGAVKRKVHMSYCISVFPLRLVYPLRCSRLSLYGTVVL